MGLGWGTACSVPARTVKKSKCNVLMSCRVSLVVEMFVRMLQHCGMPKEDVDLIHGNGKVVGEILNKAGVRSTLFTGSGKVAELLAQQLKGKVRTCCSRS